MASYNNIFKITHNNLLPAQGSILISEPFFCKMPISNVSVVLLIEHTNKGSMGFVLNKKTDLVVNSVFFLSLKSFPKYRFIWEAL